MKNNPKDEISMPGEISLRLFRTEKILKSEDNGIERKDGKPLSKEDMEKLKYELAYQPDYFVDERTYTGIHNNRTELERAWVINRGYEGNKTVFRGTVSHVSNECVAFKHLNFDLDRSWEFAYGFCDEHVRSDNIIIYDVGPFLAKGVQAGQIVNFKGLPYLYKPTKYGGLDLSIKNISKIRFHEQKDETSNLDIARRELEDFYCNELCLFTDHCYRNGICLAAEGALEGFVELMTAMTVKEDNVVNPYSVADNIKFYRKINKIKQSELADKMFVTQQEVSKWELGKSLPDTAQCAEMAKIFKVPVSNIILSSSITKEINIDYTEIWNKNIVYFKNKPNPSDFDRYCYEEAVRKKHIAYSGNMYRCLKLSDSEYDALLQFKTMNPNGTELDFWRAYFPSDFEVTTSIHSIIENAKRTYKYANVSQQKPSTTHLLK